MWLAGTCPLDRTVDDGTEWCCENLCKGLDNILSFEYAEADLGEEIDRVVSSRRSRLNHLSNGE